MLIWGYGCAERAIHRHGVPRDDACAQCLMHWKYRGMIRFSLTVCLWRFQRTFGLSHVWTLMCCSLYRVHYSMKKLLFTELYYGFKKCFAFCAPIEVHIWKIESIWACAAVWNSFVDAEKCVWISMVFLCYVPKRGPREHLVNMWQLAYISRNSLSLCESTVKICATKAIDIIQTGCVDIEHKDPVDKISERSSIDVSGAIKDGVKALNPASGMTVLQHCKYVFLFFVLLISF